MQRRFLARFGFVLSSPVVAVERGLGEAKLTQRKNLQKGVTLSIWQLNKRGHVALAYEQEKRFPLRPSLCRPQLLSSRSHGAIRRQGSSLDESQAVAGRACIHGGEADDARRKDLDAARHR